MIGQELRARVIAFNKQIKADREIVEVVTAAGVTIEAKPAAPPNRPGYKWIPKQLTASGSIMWVESEYDSTIPGTKEMPIPYIEGLTVCPNYYYVLDSVRKVWMGKITVSPAWGSENFVEC